MSQGIQEFYQTAAARGFQRDFQLRIAVWKIINSPVLTDIDTVLLKTATLPQMETTINPAPFMGLEFNVPGTTKFPGSKAWNLEFYMTQKANLRESFIVALRNNFNIDLSIGNLQLPPQDSTVQFSLVNDNLNEITRYMLHGAFIASVGEVSFDLTGSGAIQKLPVTIAYQYWTSGPFSENLGSPNNTQSTETSVGNAFIAGAEAGFRNSVGNGFDITNRLG